MEKIVIYFSFTENNKFLAEYFQNKLNCEIYKITEKKRRKKYSAYLDMMLKRNSEIEKIPFSLKKYHHILFISPVYNFGLSAPIKELLKVEKDNINNYSFATFCYGRDGQKEKLINELEKILKKPPEYLLQIKVNDLLSEEKKEKIKYMTSYKLKEEDLHFYKEKIDKILSFFIV